MCVTPLSPPLPLTGERSMKAACSVRLSPVATPNLPLIQAAAGLVPLTRIPSEFTYACEAEFHLFEPSVVP